MDGSTTNAIEVRNLVKGYKGVPVLHDVSFTVGRGTVFALLGANGSGKTTTINILTTLIKADGGTASVAGFDVAEQGVAVGKQTGSIKYIDFITPGVVILTVISGIAYAAVRLSTDLQKGIISRFRTMPVAPSSVLGGQALSSTLSNLFSCALVVAVALIVGFRPAADAVAWLLFCGLLVLLILATTWLAMFFGLLAKSVEGAGAFSYILILLIFISPSFVPTDSMTPALRAFADNQPMTPIVQTMRSLLTAGTPGSHIWGALAWAAGILAISYTLSLSVYRHRTPVPAVQ